MKEQYSLKNGKLIYMKESLFWNEILTRASGFGKQIFISTYSFNLGDRSENSMYSKLQKAMDAGTDIVLLYNLLNRERESDDFDDRFRKFAQCVYHKDNHAKIFWCNDLLYIGSNNFSVGSEHHTECGVLIEDEDVVDDFRRVAIKDLIKSGIYENVPDVSVPLGHHVNRLIERSKIMLDFIDRKIHLDNEECQELLTKMNRVTIIKEQLEKLNIKMPDVFGQLYKDSSGFEIELERSDVEACRFDIQYTYDTLYELREYMKKYYKERGRYAFYEAHDLW